MKLERVLIAAVLAAAGFARADAFAALAYPTKAVRMIVPLAPGGGSDIVGRIVAQALSEQWGKAVVVDNRPGAGSVIGTSIAAKAPPDGYTLLVSSSSIAISPALYTNLDFDVMRDFAPVTLIASQPSILVVHPTVPASSMKELIALASSKPGKLTYASAGAGSATHLGTELLLHAAHMKALHVPYKSAGLATSALLSGEAQMLLTNMASVMPYVGTGKVKVIGVSSLKRTALSPDTPTLNESGVPGFEYATWYGMLAPARASQPLISFIQKSTAEALRQPEAARRLATQGLQTYASAPAEFTRYLAQELARWPAVVKAAHIAVE